MPGIQTNTEKHEYAKRVIYANGLINRYKGNAHAAALHAALKEGIFFGQNYLSKAIGLPLTKIIIEDPIKHLGREQPYKPARRKFCRMLGHKYSIDLQEHCGLTEQQINTLRNGDCPTGYNIHHKKPRFVGGNNHPSNFVLINQNYHDLIHAYFGRLLKERQAQVGDTIEIPMTKTGVLFYKDPKHQAHVFYTNEFRQAEEEKKNEIRQKLLDIGYYYPVVTYA